MTLPPSTQAPAAPVLARAEDLPPTPAARVHLRPASRPLVLALEGSPASPPEQARSRGNELTANTAFQYILAPNVLLSAIGSAQRFESDLAELVTLTTHPSAILRAPDDERDQAMGLFVADLKSVADWLSGG